MHCRRWECAFATECVTPCIVVVLMLHARIALQALEMRSRKELVKKAEQGVKVAVTDGARARLVGTASGRGTEQGGGGRRRQEVGRREGGGGAVGGKREGGRKEAGGGLWGGWGGRRWAGGRQEGRRLEEDRSDA